MKVELSIKDDKEMRNMIKDMIKGQVTNTLRENLEKMSLNCLSNELRSRRDKKESDFLNEMDNAMEKEKKDFNVTIKDEIRKEIYKYDIRALIKGELNIILKNEFKKYFKE